MSQITIHKCKSAEAHFPTFLERLRAIADSIRNLALRIFWRRSNGTGSELRNWLQAQPKIVWSTDCGFVDDEEEFRAHIALPGFDANAIQVAAMPEALVIQAVAADIHHADRADIRFCEVLGKTAFRRIELPARIEVDQVSASLEQGILDVTAPRTVQRRAQRRAGDKSASGTSYRGFPEARAGRGAEGLSNKRRNKF
jgi:HSP20 family molecular chaperone IbpA